jgi:hypothetical protein
VGPPLPNSTLDAILALQVTIAWAGEGRCDPRRLGWWDTDLVDPTGGGDLLARLLPRTQAWASLAAARDAARRVDAEARRRMADPDRLRTLFFLGFELDEFLGDRLAALKRDGAAPGATLPVTIDLGAAFSPAGLEAALRVPEAHPCGVVPGGRHLKGAMPSSPELAVKNLAAALLPFPDHYPAPFYKVTS